MKKSLEETVRYLILFEGRTGSTMMGQLLNQNPEVIHIGEDVSKYQEEGWPKQREWIDNLLFNTSNFSDERIKPGATAVGFKVKLRKIADPLELQHYIENNNIKVIYMTRNNKIKQIASSIRAIDLYSSSGSYNINNDSQTKVPGAYEISIRRFNNTLIWLQAAEYKLECFISKLAAPIHKVVYEDLCSDMQGTMDNLFSFLEVEPTETKPKTTKITSDNLEDAISNYKELKEFYSDSIYSHMFK